MKGEEVGPWTELEGRRGEGGSSSRVPRVPHESPPSRNIARVSLRGGTSSDIQLRIGLNCEASYSYLLVRFYEPSLRLRGTSSRTHKYRVHKQDVTREIEEH